MKFDLAGNAKHPYQASIDAIDAVLNGKLDNPSARRNITAANLNICPFPNYYGFGITLFRGWNLFPLIPEWGLSI